jgi:hypothetical protein
VVWDRLRRHLSLQALPEFRAIQSALADADG